MPEGHTVHRLAREHTRELGGRPVRVSSPQGRASATARRLDGRAVEAVEALGKHLLYRFGDDTLHVHLGRFGRFVRDLRLPRPTTRLRFETERLALDLVGPTIATMIDPAQEEALRARIGPDPLRGDDPAATWAALARRRVPIGTALLDQRLFAGVGNIFRLEALHALRIDPRRAAGTLSVAEREALWATLVGMMGDSVVAGRIVSAPGGERWVYRRDRCGTCGSPVERYELGGRTAFSCPSCQGAGPNRRAAGGEGR